MTSVTLRPALAADLPALVAMLADDPFGAGREQPGEPLAESYHRAFAAIEANPADHLIVADAEGRPVGMLQLTILQHLTHQGGKRAQIEGVRVHADCRRSGIGRQMFEWAIAKARSEGCLMVQLTTNRERAGARRFYESLGFVVSHAGLKLSL